MTYEILTKEITHEQIPIFTLAFILSMFLSACNQSANSGSQPDEEESINIMTSLYPLQYFAERIEAIW